MGMLNGRRGHSDQHVHVGFHSVPASACRLLMSAGGVVLEVLIVMVRLPMILYTSN